jgi:hypothetical protein
MPITDANAYLELRDNLLKLGPDDIVTFEGPANMVVRPIPQDRWTSETPEGETIPDYPVLGSESPNAPTPMQLYLPAMINGE